MEIKQIPYIAYEAAEAKSERTIKRLILALVLSIILIFASNAIWLYAWCQYDYSSEETTYSQDGEGLNNINTGSQGDINGAETNNQETDSEEEIR
jgi:hypothetical protein